MFRKVPKIKDFYEFFFCINTIVSTWLDTSIWMSVAVVVRPNISTGFTETYLPEFPVIHGDTRKREHIHGSLSSLWYGRSEHLPSSQLKSSVECMEIPSPQLWVDHLLCQTAIYSANLADWKYAPVGYNLRWKLIPCIIGSATNFVEILIIDWSPLSFFNRSGR